MHELCMCPVYDQSQNYPIRYYAFLRCIYPIESHGLHCHAFRQYYLHIRVVKSFVVVVLRLRFPVEKN